MMIKEFFRKIKRKWLILQLSVIKERSPIHHKWIIRFARHLPSPSKINAYSVIKSNSAEKLADFLMSRE